LQLLSVLDEGFDEGLVWLCRDPAEQLRVLLESLLHGITVRIL